MNFLGILFFLPQVKTPPPGGYQMRPSTKEPESIKIHPKCRKLHQSIHSALISSTSICEDFSTQRKHLTVVIWFLNILTTSKFKKVLLVPDSEVMQQPNCCYSTWQEPNRATGLWQDQIVPTCNCIPVPIGGTQLPFGQGKPLLHRTLKVVNRGLHS